MRGIAGLLCVLCVLLGGGCDGRAPGNGAANSGAANGNVANNNGGGAGGGGREFDRAKLDAEIARLEQLAEKHPDDQTALVALADAYVRRGNAQHAAHLLNEALQDYQSALRFSPEHEEANLRVAQITQEIGAEPHAEDGKPVAVPAKPGANENQ